VPTGMHDIVITVNSIGYKLLQNVIVYC